MHWNIIGSVGSGLTNRSHHHPWCIYSGSVSLQLFKMILSSSTILSNVVLQFMLVCVLSALCAVDAQSTVGDGQRGQLSPIALRTKTTLWTCTWCQNIIVCAAWTKPWTRLVPPLQPPPSPSWMWCSTPSEQRVDHPRSCGISQCTALWSPGQLQLQGVPEHLQVKYWINTIDAGRQRKCT